MTEQQPETYQQWLARTAPTAGESWSRRQRAVIAALITVFAMPVGLARGDGITYALCVLVLASTVLLPTLNLVGWLHVIILGALIVALVVLDPPRAAMTWVTVAVVVVELVSDRRRRARRLGLS